MRTRVPVFDGEIIMNEWCHLKQSIKEDKLSATPLQSSGSCQVFIAQAHSMCFRMAQLALLSDSAITASIVPTFLGTGLLGPGTERLPLHVAGGIGLDIQNVNCANIRLSRSLRNLQFELWHVKRQNWFEAGLHHRHTCVLHACSTTVTFWHGPRLALAQASGSRTFTQGQLKFNTQTKQHTQTLIHSRLTCQKEISLNFQLWNLKFQLNESPLFRFQHPQGTAGTCTRLPMVAHCKRWLNLMSTGWSTNQ